MLPEVRAPTVSRERPHWERRVKQVKEVVPHALSIHLTLLPEVRVNRATQLHPLRKALAKRVAFANVAFHHLPVKVTVLVTHARKTITI